MEHFDQVQRAYDELVASHDIFVVPAGPNQGQTIDEQKAFMTRRAAYYLNQVDANWGLLSKTTGNNVQGLSVDVVVKHDGTWNDIGTDAEVTGGRIVKPVDSGANNDPSLAARWVQPTKELAGLNGGTPPEPPPTDEVLAKLDHIIAQNDSLKASQDAQTALLNQQTAILNQHTQLLQAILDKPSEGGKFPIVYPNYSGRLVGLNVNLTPSPRENP